MAETTTKGVVTPRKMEREFWNSVVTYGDGQWGDGFKAGVRAFTGYMSRQRIVMTRARRQGRNA